MRVDLGDLPTWIGAIGTLIAFVIAAGAAAWQVRHQRRLADTERTIAFHRDLTAGEIGAGRDRLSEYMWRVGSATGANHCWQPSWEELLGARYVDLPTGTVDLSTYPADMGTEVRETPLRDLYKILWCFERIRAAEYADLLDHALSTEILGNHAVWWEHLCARIPADRTRYRRNLTDLAAHFLTRDPDLDAWARADFTSPEALATQPQQA